MSWSGLDRSTLLRLLGNVALAVGVVAGLAIYIAASRRPPDYELPETKAYLRQLEVYGGQANVLATDLREGFAKLWRGKTLGITVAVLGALLCAGLRFVADPLPPEEDEPPGPPPPGGGERGRSARWLRPSPEAIIEREQTQTSQGDFDEKAEARQETSPEPRNSALARRWPAQWD